MRCDYCYYLEKEAFYAPSTATQPTPLGRRMSSELLETFVRDYIHSQPMGLPVTFNWHGGEALLLPQTFYQEALEYQRRYGRGREIHNTLQTNGLLMNEQWAAFFKEYNFLVGLSLDGTETQHDRYRRTIGGQGSFASVMRAVEMMQRIGTDFNILSTINRFNADEPLQYYRFLKGIGIRYIQFTPIVERVHRGMARYTHQPAPRMIADPRHREGLVEGVELAPYSVLPDQWGDFLIEVFDEWSKEDVGEVFVQLFEATLAGWMGLTPAVCTLAPECGHAGVIEHDGAVYSCDHYVYPDYRLGYIQERPLSVMMNSPEQRHFGRLKREALTADCRACRYLHVCYGECPKNRFAFSPSGEVGHCYLCPGYYRFFDHSASVMQRLRDLLRAGHPASDVMTRR